MKFGISVPNVGDPGALIDLAVQTERTGWDGFFLWDHLQLNASRPPTNDPWVLLGAMAHATSRIRLGALVTPLARRRPWKLAKEITTLDHLSGGRVVVGVGLGVPRDLEYGEFGEPVQAREHAARLDEALPILDAFLRGDRVDHDGPHYQVHARLNPPAQQRPRPPIWVAATTGHRKPAQRAAAWDGIFPLGPDGPIRPAELAELVRSLDPRPGYDVATMALPGVEPAELAAAGATWLIDGPGPEESLTDVLGFVQPGPPQL